MLIYLQVQSLNSVLCTPGFQIVADRKQASTHRDEVSSGLVRMLVFNFMKKKSEMMVDGSRQYVMVL